MTDVQQRQYAPHDERPNLREVTLKVRVSEFLSQQLSDACVGGMHPQFKAQVACQDPCCV
jgi:hypothetical protein